MLKQDVLSMHETELLSALQTSAGGLTHEEAAKRLLQFGENHLKEEKVRPLKILLAQFKSSLIYMLIAASIISYSIKDYSDGTIILVILAINAVIGFLQQYKSEKIVEKLSGLIRSRVKVLRDGEMILIDESQLVPGDIITIVEGDIAPADVRLFDATALQVNESQLTGESVPVGKLVQADGACTPDALVFAGSVIEKGKCTGVVYATGADTELGVIATISVNTQKKTQYEKSIRSFSSLLIRIVLIGLLPVFLIKLLLPGGIAHFSELLIFILAMAVAVVPEPLPAITTISLSSGALKLSKKHVVVKRLSSIEDLGNVDLLCTDKTGTITENRMVIKEIVSPDKLLYEQLAYACIIVLKSRKRRTQSSYDDAFINYVSQDVKDTAKRLVILKEIPFDPEARRRRVILQDSESGACYLVVIGAPDVLIRISNDPKAQTYMNDIADAERNGLHHLALAYKKIAFSQDFDIIGNENDIIFLGYASMYDPLRKSAKITIEQAQKLGIGIKILSGDSKEVAQYVGKQIGLIKEGGTVFTGDELALLPPGDYLKAVQTCNIFARVSPTQKFNIIKALQQTNVVAYQGDGINDAPSLKLADVAVAVNSATDIAKEDADIVLLNKSLGVIVSGIIYGRNLFININKYIKHTMVSNFGNFIALSILYLVSTDLPLLPIQVLLTTVIADVPLVTIYADTVEAEEVTKPEKHDVKNLLKLALFLGIPAALFELLYFCLVRHLPLKEVETSLYVFITFIGLIVFYSIRVKKPFWKAKPSPWLINISFILAFFLSFIIIYIPLFQRWFSFAGLSLNSVLIILGLTAAYFLITDIAKVFFYRYVLRKKTV